MVVLSDLTDVNRVMVHMLVESVMPTLVSKCSIVLSDISSSQVATARAIRGGLDLADGFPCLDMPSICQPTEKSST